MYSPLDTMARSRPQVLVSASDTRPSLYASVQPFTRSSRILSDDVEGFAGTRANPSTSSDSIRELLVNGCTLAYSEGLVSLALTSTCGLLRAIVSNGEYIPPVVRET